MDTCTYWRLQLPPDQPGADPGKVPEEEGGLHGAVGAQAHQHKHERDDETVEPDISRTHLQCF